MVDKWMEATMRIREWPPKIERLQKDCRMLQFRAARYLNKINAIIRAVTVR